MQRFAEPVGAERLHMIFEIGGRDCRVAPCENTELTWRHRERAGAA